MLVHERQHRILEYLQQRPSSSVTQLLSKLDISRSTLRRDLVELEERGEIVRVHGGVVHRDSLRGEPSYDRRGREAMPAKRAIAVAAAELVPPDSVVFLDAGTTCVEVALQLAARDDLKIFTHSVRLLIEVGDCAASVTCVGGEYRHVSQALVGGLSLKWLDHLHCDIAFLGASGLTATEGAATTETSEAVVKQAIMNRSRRSVLVCDANKWAHSAAVTFASWNEIHSFVTDQLPEKKIMKSITSQGTEVLVSSET